MSKKAGLYARVSTKNQDLERQKEKLTDWAEKEGYEYDLEAEKITGKNDDREGFQKIMSGVYKNDYDIVAVTKIDRFGRSTTNILQNIDKVEEEGASFVTIDQPIDTREDQGMFAETMKQLLSMFADLERRMIRQRMEGPYREALEEGKVGRPSALSQTQLQDAVEKHEKGWSFTEIHRYIEGKYDKDVSYDAIRQNIKKAVEVN